MDRRPETRKRYGMDEAVHMILSQNMRDSFQWPWIRSNSTGENDKSRMIGTLSFSLDLDRRTLKMIPPLQSDPDIDRISSGQNDISKPA
jgi:hypothetical protein